MGLEFLFYRTLTTDNATMPVMSIAHTPHASDLFVSAGTLAYLCLETRMGLQDNAISSVRILIGVFTCLATVLNNCCGDVM